MSAIARGCGERIDSLYNIYGVAYLALWGLFFLFMILHWVIPGPDRLDDWAQIIGVYGILPGTVIALIMVGLKHVAEQENW